jgi:hypothetical protein
MKAGDKLTSQVTIKSSKNSLVVMSAKIKVVPVLKYAPRHENVWRTGGIAPSILNLGAVWR